MGVSWLKKGEDSAALAERKKAEDAKAASEVGKMWRFWVNKGEEARITFIDGELNDQGVLMPPRFYEHQLYLSGNWNNFFVCPEKTNPESGQKCPICEGGDKPYLVAMFTILDHRTSKSKDGTKAYKDQPRLFPAKPASFELLNKLAQKRGGLRGITFDAMRTTDDKSPAVGSTFDFVEKNKPEELEAKYTMSYEKDGKTVTVSKFVAAEYDKEIVYRTEDELRQLGFGKAVVGGSNPGQQSMEGKPDYTKEL